MMFDYTKDELKKLGYNKMIVGCLKENKSNNFYRHMGGLLVGNKEIILSNGEKHIENIYCYESI